MSDRTRPAGGSGPRAAPSFPLAWWLAPAILLLAWLPGAAESALFDPDEGRNASIALAMANGGSWLVPRLNGLPFLDKPFLFFACQAFGFRLFGASELTARLPSLLSGALLVVLLAAFVGRRRGEEGAWLAAVSSASSLLLIAFARVASFDALLALLVAIAVLALFEAVEAGAEDDTPGAATTRRRWLLVGWTAMALGVLTKGPVALALPLLVVGIHAAIRRRSRRLWSGESVACGLTLIFSWALVVESREPGFLRYALVEESWHRTTTSQFQRGGPLWYFVPILLIGAFPWIVPAGGMLLRALRRPRGVAPDLLLGALWLGVPFALLSVSESKRPQYMMLVLPAVSLLAAVSFANSGRGAKNVRVAAVTWIALAIALAAALGARTRFPKVARALEDPATLRIAAVVAVVAAAGGVLAWLGASRPRLGPLAAAMPIVLLPWLSRGLVTEVSASRSSRDLVAALEPLRRQGVALVGIDSFMPSLPFYLKEELILSAASLRSLTSRSMLHFESRIRESTPGSLREEGWWKSVLASDRRAFAFLIRKGRDSEISVLREAGLELLFEGKDYLVFGEDGLPGPGMLRGATPPDSSPARASSGRRKRRGRGIS